MRMSVEHEGSQLNVETLLNRLLNVERKEDAMYRLVSLVVGVLLCGCTLDVSHNEHAVRQQFVPICDGRAATSCYGGAAWSRLGPLSDEGILMAQAWAGVRDSFPVQDEAERTLFEVMLVEADDDYLLVDVCSKDGAQRVNLRRDKTVTVEVDGKEYGLLYPSVFVSSTDAPTTGRVMLTVLCRP